MVLAMKKIRLENRFILNHGVNDEFTALQIVVLLILKLFSLSDSPLLLVS